jgi:hypothetical protein
MASGEMSEVEFVSFLNNSLRLMAGYSANNSVHYICMDWRHAGDLIAAGKQNYDEFLNLCVWVKDNGGMGSSYRSQHELVLVFRKASTAATEPMSGNTLAFIHSRSKARKATCSRCIRP